MNPPRSEPSSFRPPAADSVPVRPLAFWALLVPLAYAPSLLVGTGFDARGLAGLAAATALALVSVWALTRGPALDRVAAALESPAPLLLVAATVTFAAHASVQAAAGLAAHGEYAIAGLFGQSFWTLLHGLPFVNSQETVNGSLASHFGIHFSPTLLLLTPFYLLWPHPLTLMVAQVQRPPKWARGARGLSPLRGPGQRKTAQGDRPAGHPCVT